MLVLIFFTSKMPMWDGLNNGVHIFNEIAVTYLCLGMLLFTDYVPDPVMRYDFGYKFLYVCAFVVIVNILVFLYLIISGIILAIRRSYLKRQARKAQALRVEAAKLKVKATSLVDDAPIDLRD